ncbi:hypothetical protein ABZO35_04630 [Burkholderia pseudomallei]|uniref:hypothetical protein n=1 Tax=Burkholderia pseudomallei TaxID=28450 RepID=UPI003450286B
MHNDAKYFVGKGPQLETKKREAHLSAYIDEAIRQAMRDRPREVANNHTAIYHRSFPIGSALAEVFAHRSIKSGGGPLSLVHVIEQLIGKIPAETPEQQARRGILCGLCWEIGAILKLGGNGGFRFNVDDEGTMFMAGVRRSRHSDARMVIELAKDDECESEFQES